MKQEYQHEIGAIVSWIHNLYDGDEAIQPYPRYGDDCALFFCFSGKSLFTNVAGDHLVVEYLAKGDDETEYRKHTLGELKRMMKLKAFL